VVTTYTTHTYIETHSGSNTGVRPTIHTQTNMQTCIQSAENADRATTILPGINTYINAARQEYIHTYIHTYIHAYIHTCIHTYYIHTYIHTTNVYTHTYMHT